MKKYFILILVLLLISVLAFPETVYLKNNDVISGTFSEVFEKSIIVKTNQGELEIFKKDIDRIDYNDKEQNKLKEQNSAFILRPLPTLAGAAFGYFDLVFEGQTAFSEKWAGTCIGEIGSIEDITVWSMQIGPQYRPKGEYLKGFLFGLYPGIGYATDYWETIWFSTLTIETGYQWILDSGIVFGLTTGGSYLSYNPYGGLLKFNISAHIGYAFKDPWIKAD